MSGSGGLYDITLYKEITLQEAEKELVELKINPEYINLEEEDFEEDLSDGS